MTEHDREEARLEALFDSTAAEPDRMQLTKLRARAAEVATLRRRRPWWQLLVPVAAVAAVALVTTLGTRTRDPAMPNAALASLSAPAIGPTASVPLAAAPADDGELAESDLDVPLAGASMLADDPGDLFAPLDEPSEDDADVWLSAAGAFLEDG